MDNFELFFQFRGIESILGFSVLLGITILAVEFCLLSVMSDVYYRKGPLLKRKRFKYSGSRVDVIRKLEILSNEGVIRSRVRSDYVLVKFRSSVVRFFVDGYIHTHRIILYFDENEKVILCEARRLVSTVLLPIIIVLNIAISPFISGYPEKLYFSIIKILASVVIAIGLYYLLRGNQNSVGDLEHELVS